MHRMVGVTPGAHVLLHAHGERAVKALLGLVDGMEGYGIDPCTASAADWGAVGHRLAAGEARLRYTPERPTARTVREVLG
jgi:hypothetical protein